MRGFVLLLLVSPTLMAGTSNSLMDVSSDGRRLLVANTDRGTVTVVDLAARKVLCELPAGDHPGSGGMDWQRAARRRGCQWR